ncbi:DnaB-like helicase C-terminal domain-containing protein [Candidatus Vidania fulgoroideorum]
MSNFYSSYVEKILIGNIILDNKIFFKIENKIDEKDFYFLENRNLFKTIKRFILKKKKVDPILLNEKKNIKLKYINHIIKIAYRNNNVEEYIKVIKKKSIKRKIYFLLKKICDDFINGTVKIKEIKEKIYKIFENLLKKDNSNSNISEEFKRYLDDYDKKNKNVMTGYNKFDKLTSGLNKGELIILAGRPSVGKTAFAINICENVSIKMKNGINLTSLILTMEMSSKQILYRILSSLLKKNSNEILKKKIKKNKILKAKKLISKSKIILDDTINLTPEKLFIKLKNTIDKKEISLLIIDYLQLMSIDNYKENRTSEVSKISRALKNIAKEFNIVVIALSQLNRNLELRYDKTPILSDLKESGSIEQDADIIVLMYKIEKDENIKFIVAKNRNGPTGSFKLRFIKKYTKFKNI